MLSEVVIVNDHHAHPSQDDVDDDGDNPNGTMAEVYNTKHYEHK